jgi:hypothetical protein
VTESPAHAVRAFHEKFNFPIDRGLKGLRWRLLAEEYREYQDAEAADDLVEIADALGDMVYVIYGTALTYGIDLDAVVAEIHRSNMTKETHPSGKAAKGPGYERPDIQAVMFS